MKTRKMIRPGWLILLIILVLMLVILAVLYLLQKDNLKAVSDAKQYSQAQLEEQLAESRQAVEETLAEQYPEIQVRDLTDEERAALREGSMSREELISALTGSSDNSGAAAGSAEEPGSSSAPGASTGSGSSSEPVPVTQPPSAPAETEAPAQSSAPAETEAPAQSSAPAETEAPAQSSAPVPVETAAPAEGQGPSVPESSSEPTPEEEYNAALSAVVAEVYVMREEYSVQLEEMFAEAKAEYAAMPEEDRSRSKLISWASGYLSRASALEKQCDAKMDDILLRVQQLAEKYGQDTSIVNTLAYSYALEKSIQKSLYIQELEKRGIL